MQVQVYYNINQKCYSVKHNGKVILHCDSILLDNVSFNVQKGGRDRVIKSGQKNVHAFIKGSLVSYREVGNGNIDVKWLYRTIGSPVNDVTYNPRKYSSFVVRKSEQPISSAEYAYCDNSGVIATKVK